MAGLLLRVLADNSTSRWGRRRPFMVGGSVAVALSLVVLGWAPAMVAGVVGNDAAVRTPSLRAHGAPC